MVGISAPYIHPITGIISAILVSFFRVMMGAVGVLIGVIGICGGGLIGIIFYLRNRSTPKTCSIPKLIFFGLLLTVQAQFWISVLYPWDVAVKLFKSASSIRLVSYRIGTLMIGLILNRIIYLKSIQKRLSESEQKFSKVLRHAPIMMAPGELETGIILDANQKQLEASGYSNQELIGKSSLDIEWIALENRNRLA